MYENVMWNRCKKSEKICGWRGVFLYIYEIPNYKNFFYSLIIIGLMFWFCNVLKKVGEFTIYLWSMFKTREFEEYDWGCFYISTSRLYRRKLCRYCRNIALSKCRHSPMFRQNCSNDPNPTGAATKFGQVGRNLKRA